MLLVFSVHLQNPCLPCTLHLSPQGQRKGVAGCRWVVLVRMVRVGGSRRAAALNLNFVRPKTDARCLLSRL